MNRMIPGAFALAMILLPGLPDECRAQSDRADSSLREQQGGFLSSLDVHAGVGLAQGARIGLRLQLATSFLLETSYGVEAGNLIGATNAEYRYSVGVDWFPSEGSTGVVSLLFVTQSRPDGLPRNLFEDGFLSLSVGWLPMARGGLNVFLRCGGSFRLYNSNPNLLNPGIGSINVDVGLNYVVL